MSSSIVEHGPSYPQRQPSPRFKKGRWGVAEAFQGRTGRLLRGWSVWKVAGTSWFGRFNSSTGANAISPFKRAKSKKRCLPPSKMPCGCPAGLELLAKVLDNVSWKYWKPGEQPAKILDWMPLGPSPTVGDGLWTKILYKYYFGDSHGSIHYRVYYIAFLLLVNLHISCFIFAYSVYLVNTLAFKFGCGLRCIRAFIYWCDDAFFLALF